MVQLKKRNKWFIFIFFFTQRTFTSRVSRCTRSEWNTPIALNINETAARGLLYDVAHRAFRAVYSGLLPWICISKCANADYCKFIWRVSNARKTRFIAIKVNARACIDATRFPHNHRLSPPRLLIAVSLSRPPQRGEMVGERAEGHYASRRSARITADYTDKIARCISRARKRVHIACSQNSHAIF